MADRDPLTKAVMERMLAGVSTRRYQRIQEPIGSQVEQAERSTSKSAISRSFVARTAETLAELMGRRLDDVRLAVLMVDVWVLETRCGAELGVDETIGGRRPHPRMRNRHHPGFIAAEAAVQLGLVGSAA